MRILQLRHEQGWSFAQIANELGDAANGGRATAKSVQAEYLKATRDMIPIEEITAARTLTLDELDMLKREALAVMRRPHFLVQFGKVAIDPRTKAPMIDDGPVLSAIRVLMEIERRRAAIYGYEAPKRQTVLAITQEHVDAAIRQLQEELGPEEDDEGDEIADAELVEDD